jgi:hypothetical protein
MWSIKFGCSARDTLAFDNVKGTVNILIVPLRSTRIGDHRAIITRWVNRFSINPDSAQNARKKANGRRKLVLTPGIKSYHWFPVLRATKTGSRGYRWLQPVFLLVVISCSGQTHAVDARVCDLVRNPSAFDNEIVRARARVISSIEGAALVDDGCRGQGLVFWIDKSVQGNAEFKKLAEAASTRGYQEPVRKIVYATMTGRLLLRPGKQPRVLLVAISVQSIEVKEQKFGHSSQP